MLYLTDSANERLTKWVKESESNFVRLSFKTAGCTGLMYEVILEDKIDVVKDYPMKYDNFDILIEHEYFNAINGATLDYITEGFNSHFELVDNPNEKAKCGCGESFSI